MTLNMTTTTPPWPPSLRRRDRFFALVACLLSLIAPAAHSQTTQAVRQAALFAVGAEDQYWVAVVEAVKDAKGQFKTVVRTQGLPAGDWREQGTVFGQAVGVARSY